MASQTIVIKLGTSTILDKTHLQLEKLSKLVETVQRLRSCGHKVVIVSSGAIGIGMKRMNIQQRPVDLTAKQVISAHSD